jgi:hypothetical protein
MARRGLSATLYSSAADIRLKWAQERHTMPMSKMAVNPVSAPPTDALRRTFETAIAQMQESPQSVSPSQTPIFVRKQTTIPDDSASKKRALTAAARALAQLWNISPSLIR